MRWFIILLVLLMVGCSANVTNQELNEFWEKDIFCNYVVKDGEIAEITCKPGGDGMCYNVKQINIYNGIARFVWENSKVVDREYTYNLFLVSCE